VLLKLVYREPVSGIHALHAIRIVTVLSLNRLIDADPQPADIFAILLWCALTAPIQFAKRCASPSQRPLIHFCETIFAIKPLGIFPRSPQLVSAILHLVSDKLALLSTRHPHFTAIPSLSPAFFSLLTTSRFSVDPGSLSAVVLSVPALNHCALGLFIRDALKPEFFEISSEPIYNHYS